MVHTISLYAFRYWATRNYYIDCSCNVDKLVIRGHNAISSSNPDTRTLLQCTKSTSKPNIQSPKAIRVKSGAVAFSRSQILQRWSKNFCDLFLGNETTWSSLLHNFKSFQAAVNDPDCPDNTCLRSLFLCSNTSLRVRPSAPMAYPRVSSSSPLKR